MSKVVHFEIPADHPEKVMEFFSKTFGWTFQQFGNEPYWLAMTGDEKQPGINGGIMKKNHPQQPVTNSISSSDIDADMKKVKQNGGEIVVPKSVIPGVGYICYFKDPDGNIHGIHQSDPKAQ